MLSLNELQVEDYVLCGDTRITCQPMMNGNNDDDQILLRDIHEGLTAKMSINDFLIHKTCIKK